MKLCDSCGDTLTENKYRQVVMYGETLCHDCIAQDPTELGDCIQCGKPAWLNLDCVCNNCETVTDFGNPFAREGDNQ